MSAHTITNELGGHWKNRRGQAPCPICQPERRPDQNALSIRSSNGKLLLHCFKRRCSFAEIANAVDLPLDSLRIDFLASRDADRRQAEYTAHHLTKARSLWDAARPIAGTMAEAYLRGRGITVPLPSSLRFMPDIYHGPSASQSCAMVADVQPTGGVHRTYFDTRGNRLTKNAKMMLGPCCGGAVRLSGGGWAAGLCVRCIETGLSLVQLLAERSPEVWAALSTSGMKALALPTAPRELIVATDGDEPGRKAGRELATRATALSWIVKLLPAPDGSDWNDALRQSGVAA